MLYNKRSRITSYYSCLSDFRGTQCEMKASTSGNAEGGCGVTSGLVHPPGDAAQGPGLAAFPLKDELPRDAHSFTTLGTFTVTKVKVFTFLVSTLLLRDLYLAVNNWLHLVFAFLCAVKTTSLQRSARPICGFLEKHSILAQSSQKLKYWLRNSPCATS